MFKKKEVLNLDMVGYKLNKVKIGNIKWFTDFGVIVNNQLIRDAHIEHIAKANKRMCFVKSHIISEYNN